MEEEVSKLAAMDGFSFNSIAKSDFIQRNLHSQRGKDDKLQPTTANGVRNMDICADDTDLLKVEYSIEFLLNKLNIVGNPLALNLRERLMHRYNKRRNVETLTLLRYLHNPRKFKGESISGPFLFLTKQHLRKYAEQTYRRLFPEHDAENTTELYKENEIGGNLKTNVPSTYEGNGLIRECTSAMRKMNEEPKIVSDGFGIPKEFEYFEATSNRSEKLEKLYRALLTTKATSVQSERAFSITGLSNTKIRTSLLEFNYRETLFNLLPIGNSSSGGGGGGNYKVVIGGLCSHQVFSYGSSDLRFSDAAFSGKPSLTQGFHVDVEAGSKEIREKEKEKIRARAEKERVRNEREEKERVRNEREEKERVRNEREEKERVRNEREEKERVRNEREEKERVRNEREEKERVRNEREEKERVRNEREEKERVRNEREEKERVRNEREEEKERVRNEREEKERVRNEREEKERVRNEREEKEGVRNERALV
ncbi:Hypothetical predicted protein [Octopus vulgaris]|uniref:Uncharacterized protein n=1 Tax=Octopus vulgaris TaxID=6645 RepID=A0AA36F7C9_OCTVU|nr:Hypothetical predicted protein [Octopus vulgaris]